MRRDGLGGLTPATDPGDAGWVVAGLTGGGSVGSLVPVFPAYARVLHPARDRAETDVSWAAVAAANGTRVHAHVQWPPMTGSTRLDDEQPGVFSESPDIGSLPAVQADRLLTVLRRFTGSADAYYAVWDAYAPPDDGASFELFGQRMLLFRGPLADAARVSMGPAPFEHSPNLWWPADRTWCVATDYDLVSTYLGGSAEAIAAVLADDRLEAWPARRDDRIDVASDTINPPPRG